MRKLAFMCLLAMLVAFAGPGWANVEINETNFPDANFREYVSENFDTINKDGKLDDEEIAGATYIDVKSRDISSLKGIEHLIALTRLFCNANHLTELDVSKNTKLTMLHCGSNQLTLLDVSANTALTYLCCNYNQLMNLDVSKNTALETLLCDGNQLSNLDVSKNTALTALNCSRNHQLSSLDVSANTSLTDLDCGYNQLTELNVSKNTALKRLTCDGNQLSSLDVSKNTALTFLWCHTNQFTELDVSANTALTVLSCSYSQLTTLNVSKNTALTRLDCEWNQLTALDVSNNVALTDLSCGHNQLIELNVNKNTALMQLWCENNQFNKLDVSMNTALQSLFCESNQLTTLDLHNNAELLQLRCYNNRLTELDLSKNTKLTQLIGADTLQIVPDMTITDSGNSEYPYQVELPCDASKVEKVQGYYRYIEIDTAWTSADKAALFVTSPDRVIYHYLHGYTGTAEDSNSGVLRTICVALERDSSNDPATDPIPVPVKEILISEDFFPDAIFRSYVSENFDTDGDGILSKEEIAKATVINVSNMGISNLYGLEHFTSLKELYCASNNLTYLPMSAAATLERLECANNQLRYLALNRYTSLKRLNCRGQVFPYLYVTDTQDDDEESGGYPYWSESLVSLMSYRSSVSDVKAYDSAGLEIPIIVGEEYDVYFASMPAKLTYDYKTGAPVSSDLMDVTLSEVHYSGKHTPTIPVAPDDIDSPTSTKGTIVQSGDHYVFVSGDVSIPVGESDDSDLIGGNADAAPNLEIPTSNDATPEQVETLENISNNNGESAETVQSAAYTEPLEATSLDITAVYNVVGDKWPDATFRSVSNDMDQTDNRGASEKALTARKAVEQVQALLGTGKRIAFAYVLRPMKPKKTGIFTFALLLAPDMVTGHRLIWSVIRSARGMTDGAIQVAGASLTADDTTAVFIDTTTGKEITSVPESRAVTVSTYLDEKYDYEPVVLTEADKSSDSSGGGGGGGGCNTLSAGLALIALCGLVARKK